MTVLDIVNIKGEKVGKVNLHPEIFEGKINQDVVYQDIYRLLASRREGTASTKTRGEVRGGGRKPWRQKGTGRARAGSIRAPHWRGGGIVFGPHPRDYSISLPKKVIRLAIKSALRDRLNTNSILVIDELKVERPKTKEVASLLKRLKIEEKKVIFLFDKKDETFIRAARNIEEVTLKNVRSLNTFDILYNDILIFSKEAFNSLEKRLIESTSAKLPLKESLAAQT